MKDTLAYRLMKDVTSCDKLRVAANSVNPEISEWGNLCRVMSTYPYLNTYGKERNLAN